MNDKFFKMIRNSKKQINQCSNDNQKNRETIKKQRFNRKRKLKRERAKLKRNIFRNTDLSKKVKSNEKNELWFEVDQIHLEKAINPGYEPRPLKDDDLIKKMASTGITKVVGIDCEMVGIGASKKSAIARISIVNQFGHTIYDKFVLPEEKITDYRTFVSGIRPEDLINGLNIDIARQEVRQIICGKLLVGHAVHNDLFALKINHPKKFIRDTSIYFRKMFNNKVPSLKRLAETLLNVKIQTGEHSSVEDAKVAMRLYTMHRKNWESSIAASTRLAKSSKSINVNH